MSPELENDMSNTYRYLKFEVVEGVATITLNRPEKMNAFTFTLGDELSNAYARCDADDDIRVVILTGAGSAFCAGADMEGGSDTFSNTDGRSKKTEKKSRKASAAFQVRKPVIAAINGHAVGIGLTLALQCDIRIVARDARLSFPFVRLGIVPELGSTSILPSIAGMSNALDLMLSGRRFSGEDAVHYGLASEAVDASEVLEKAREWAIDVARNAAPVAVAVTKRLIWEGVDSTPAEASAKERELLSWLGKQPDAAEGVKSFLERREPEWKLRVSKDLPDQ